MDPLKVAAVTERYTNWINQLAQEHEHLYDGRGTGPHFDHVTNNLANSLTIADGPVLGNPDLWKRFRSTYNRGRRKLKKYLTILENNPEVLEEEFRTHHGYLANHESVQSEIMRELLADLNANDYVELLEQVVRGEEKEALAPQTIEELVA